MIEETRALIEEIRKLDESQKGPYQTLLIVTLVRDLAYYAVLGLIAWSLGRRIVQAVLAVVRESRRGRT
jgi:hypothetical protein